MINVYRVFYHAERHGRQEISRPQLLHSNSFPQLTSVDQFSLQDHAYGYCQIARLDRCNTQKAVVESVKRPLVGADGCLLIVTPLVFEDGTKILEIGESSP